jgi:hypothetical protein
MQRFGSFLLTSLVRLLLAVDYPTDPAAVISLLFRCSLAVFCRCSSGQSTEKTLAITMSWYHGRPAPGRCRVIRMRGRTRKMR